MSNSDNYPNIVKTPGTCGGRARIKDRRLAVWFLVAQSRVHPVEEIAHLYEVSPELVQEALNYAANNKLEIGQDLIDQGRA